SLSRWPGEGEGEGHTESNYRLGLCRDPHPRRAESPKEMTFDRAACPLPRRRGRGIMSFAVRACVASCSCHSEPFGFAQGKLREESTRSDSHCHEWLKLVALKLLHIQAADLVSLPAEEILRVDEFSNSRRPSGELV